MKNWIDKPLTRRAWMGLTGAALSGCGGGGSSLLATLPGTGGTGAVFAQGTISGFGSVIVNGVKFDDLQAMVALDGRPAASVDLRVGMVAEIQGERGADMTLGTASKIEVWTIAQGVVSGLVPGGFVLTGMTILCDVATALDGIASVSEIAPGQALAVWGLQASANASQWTATRVTRVAQGLPVVSSGLTRTMDGAMALHGVPLKGDAVATIMAGTLVRVEGVLLVSGALQVSQGRSLNQLATRTGDERVEIQGYVTERITATQFKLGLTDVDGSAVTSQQLALLAVGDRVEVYGNWRSGVLVATRVTLESELNLQSSEITGIVAEFNSLADFVVRGERCDASVAVFSHGLATDLRNDVLVKVEGTRSGAVLRVTSVEFES